MANSYKRSSEKDDLIAEKEVYDPSADDKDTSFDKRKNKSSSEPQTTEKKKKEKKKLTKKQNLIVNSIMAGVLAVVMIIMVLTIINRQVELTEINQQINDERDILEEKQSLYTQLEMKVDANLSTAVIEKYAQEKLGMNKASNSQKEFINLSQGDKAEVTVENNSNIFTAISDAFSNLW